MFTRADQSLSAEDDAELLAAYARFEAAEFAPRAQEGHVASASQLAYRYDVPRAAEPA